MKNKIASFYLKCKKKNFLNEKQCYKRRTLNLTKAVFLNGCSVNYVD